MKKNRNLKPAVGYIRMSTDMQTDSPKQQKDEIRKLARRGRYDIIRWYEDLGISGDEVENARSFVACLPMRRQSLISRLSSVGTKIALVVLTLSEPAL